MEPKEIDMIDGDKKDREAFIRYIQKLLIKQGIIKNKGANVEKKKIKKVRK